MLPVCYVTRSLELLLRLCASPCFEAVILYTGMSNNKVKLAVVVLLVGPQATSASLDSIFWTPRSSWSSPRRGGLGA